MESAWASELIVRVPQLLAHHSGEQDKQLLIQQASELFGFYEQHTRLKEIYKKTLLELRPGIKFST
jgi:hypothetical protein